MMKNVQNSTAFYLSERVEEHLKLLKGLLVAYSGGVDSATLAYLAYKALGQNMLAVIADSPSLSRRELNDAVQFAKNHNIPLKVIKTEELQNPSYQKNSGDRCYYCKEALFFKMQEIQNTLEKELGSPWPIAFGANLDDLGDYRPGVKAAQEFKVLAPFVDLKITKEDIREIGREFRLEVSEKAAMPCLASRIPHGEVVDSKKLMQVEQAEDFLRDLGLVQVRVRHHGELAKIEVPDKDMFWILEHKHQIVDHFKRIGFLYISLGLVGFSSGTLNASLDI